MIDLYYWPTPNAFKITIMVEECGLQYRIRPVNIFRGDQFAPDFLRISPNNRMPAIVDDDCEGGPISIFESGAILVYLAEKTGQFMPRDVHGRFEVQQWLYWQMANLGPISGQCGHFRHYAPQPVPYAIDRYTREVNRLYGVMNQRLADREFLAGDYSIADMASWPWLRPWKRYDQKLDDFPHLKDWFQRMEARPAVQKAIKVGADLITQQPSSEEARRILFGQTASTLEEQRRAHQS